MDIAVNTRILLKNRLEGVGWFTRETLERITRQHPEHRFHFFFDRPWAEEFIFSDNIVPHVLSPQARHPVLFYIWFEHAVTRALRKVKASLFLSPDGYLSLRTGVPSVSVIHDLNFEHNPGDVPFLVRRYYLHYFPRFAKKAARIATVSEFSKHDIESCYGISPGKIDVVYNGVNELYGPAGEEERRRTREKVTGGLPYFLFIGALLPRKNIVNLLKAFDLFRTAHPHPYKLVIVGEKKWWTSAMEKAWSGMKHAGDVVFLGRQRPADLKDILASARALVFVPYFEGFGIPVVEAMRSGTPVIASDCTSLPEVCGDAALMVDPHEVHGISEAMRKLAADEGLARTLAEKGLARAAQFSWQATADKLWACMEKAMP